VRIFGLRVPHVCVCNADISHEMELVTHVPGIAVHHDHERFRELLGPSERIDLTVPKFESVSGFRKSREGLDVVPAGEVLAVAKKQRCPERGIIIEIVVCLGQTVKCVRVDAVEHLRPIDPDEDNLFPPLHRDLGIGGFIRHAAHLRRGGETMVVHGLSCSEW
jgi:hypothetical protein